MKTFLALAALVLCTSAAPLSSVSSPSDAPKGTYFVLPPAPQTQTRISPEQVEEVMNQLRQEDGSDSGVYHIVLPDGRLQRVEYTTAPVADQETPSQQQQAAPVPGPAALLAQSFKPSAAPVKSAPAQLEEQPSGPAALIAQSPRPVPAPQASEQINLGPNPRLFLVAQTAPEQEESAQVNEQPARPVKYVASIQYTEVQPITGPIYSYNDQPLTRVVRYASLY